MNDDKNARAKALLEDFEREKNNAHELGVEAGAFCTNFRVVSSLAVFHNEPALVQMPRWPDELTDTFNELAYHDELSEDTEIAEAFFWGFCEGCARALEQMKELRNSAVEKASKPSKSGVGQ